MTRPVLLITGASRGIGNTTARHAVAAGYRLAVLARQPETVQPLVEELGADTVEVLKADITEWQQVCDAVTAAEERLGRIDAAFANAGHVVDTSFLGNGGADPEEWRQMVLTNVYGTAITARAALPALVRSGGHLVMTGSIAGLVTRPGSLYSATKWAVGAMAAAIRAEIVGTGVRCTVIHPGLVDTEMLTGDLRSMPKLDTSDIARAVLYALAQPPSVDVNELVVRPTGQDATR